MRRLALLGLLGLALGCRVSAGARGGADADADAASGARGDARGNDAAAGARGETGDAPPHLHPDAGDAAVDAGPPADAQAARDFAPPAGTPELKAIAGELHGAFLELECDSEEIELQFCLPRDRGMRSLSLKLGGEAGRSYAVVLEVWGVMEVITYRNGTKAGDHFYVGGQSGHPDTAEYTLQIGADTYRLNHQEIGAGEHYTYGLHYRTPAIRVPGGATAVLSVRDPDNFINTNHMASEAEEPTPALLDRLSKMKDQPIQWQYVYVEVASARLAP